MVMNMELLSVGVMASWVFQRNGSFLNIFPDKFYNYIIIYFLIKKYIIKTESSYANPLILP
jgi:hypothetical protein